MLLRTNKVLLIIFTISILIYLLSCFGIFDGLSEFGAKSLYNALGYSSKWSKSYGPFWFVGTSGAISSLGSREIVFIFSAFMYFYLRITRNKSHANNFIFTIAFAIVFILVTKIITSKDEYLNFNSILAQSLSNFPSGHTFAATVLYLSIAKYLASSNKSDLVNRYLLISASIIIALVGISRFVGAGHTITEVIAGWSLGLCWFSFVQMFLKIDYKTFFNK